MRYTCKTCKADDKACDHCPKKGNSETEELRQPLVGNLDRSQHHYSCCGEKKISIKFSLCYNCEVVHYCSKSCQKRQWSEHNVLRNEISELSKSKSKNIEKLGNYNACCMAVGFAGGIIRSARPLPLLPPRPPPPFECFVIFMYQKNFLMRLLYF